MRGEIKTFTEYHIFQFLFKIFHVFFYFFESVTERQAENPWVPPSYGFPPSCSPPPRLLYVCVCVCMYEGKGKEKEKGKWNTRSETDEDLNVLQLEDSLFICSFCYFFVSPPPTHAKKMSMHGISF